MSDENIPPGPPPADPPPPSQPPGSPPPGPPPAPTSGGGGNRQAFLVLSYLWILALVPLLVEKRDKEVQWHAKHGLVLMIAEFMVWIGFWIATTFLGDLIGCLSCAAYPLVFGAFLVMRIFLIVKALGGERFLIPGVSQFADQL